MRKTGQYLDDKFPLQNVGIGVVHADCRGPYDKTNSKILKNGQIAEDSIRHTAQHQALLLMLVL